MNTESTTLPKDLQNNTPYDPLVSEFADAEAEIAYQQWLKAKLDKAEQSTQPCMAHDAVMAEMRAMLAAKGLQRAA